MAGELRKSKMPYREVLTVTSNEEYVRLRIYDGDLQISEAGAELLRLERAQHEATRQQLREALARFGTAKDGGRAAGGAA